MNEKNNPLISIIMGVRNGGSRIMDAIQSIETQTYTNWEFIICDDGSTDDTYSKLLEYAKDKQNYKIIQNKTNVGLAATLNHCIEHCSGEYIARMDDDDLSYPDRFKKQVEYLQLHPETAFLSSSADIFDGEKIVSQRILLQNPTKKDLVYGSRFIHPATMFRASALKAVGGYRVCKDTVRGQDYDLFMRLYGAGYFGANLTEPLFRYTQDKANFKRRTFKARVGEMKIRIHGFKAMGVMCWAFPFVFKPLAAWVVTLFKSKR